MPRRRKVTRLDHQSGQTALVDAVRSVNAFQATPANSTPGPSTADGRPLSPSATGCGQAAVPGGGTPARSWRRRGIVAQVRMTSPFGPTVLL